MNPDPFGALGLPARPDLTDDDVRAAWRRVAAATHPDRADGGDPGRFAEAAAAYTELRTRYGRGEAYADLAAGARQHSPAGTRRRPAADAQQHPAAGARRHSTAGARARPPAAAGTLAGAAPAARPARPARPARTGLASRIAGGRPAVFALRLAISAGVIAVAFLVTGSQPAAAGLATGVITWFLLTARHDLAPPG